MSQSDWTSDTVLQNHLEVQPIPYGCVLHVYMYIQREEVDYLCMYMQTFCADARAISHVDMYVCMYVHIL